MNNALPILAAALIQYTSVVAPMVPPETAAEGGATTARTGTVPIVQYQACAAPVLVPTPVVFTASASVTPQYPSRIHPKRGLGAQHQQAFGFDAQWTAPAVVAAPDLPQTQLPQMVRRKFVRALYEPATPEWGLEVRVPVLSWTGHYPDRHPAWAKQTHARLAPSLFWDNQIFPAVVVPPDLAVPVYPDRIHRTPHLRQYPQASQPTFVADVTVVAQSLSWQPEHADFAWPKVRLHASRQQVIALSPNPIPVVAVGEVFGPHRFRVPAHNRVFRVPAHKRRFSV